MKKNKTNHAHQALELFAALNPVPATHLTALAEAAERERTYALILSRRNEAPRLDLRHARLRPAALATVAVVALALPALALSGQLGSLFRFSNPGSAVDTTSLDLNTASALQITGTDAGTLKLLASRDGVGIYAARTANGGVCYFSGAPDQPDERGLGGGCLNAEASARFPSLEQPVVDMTGFMYKPRAMGETVIRLAGVAADGVAKVQVLGLGCQVIAAAPVVDNVYVNANVPDTPAVGIEAIGNNGRRVYLEKLRFWRASSCVSSSG